jgi:hypothetical protein
MPDNVVNFTKPKELMPARWRRHADTLNQTRADIDALRKRLKQEMRDFLDVMMQDMSPVENPNITRDEQKAIAAASRHLDKCGRDALTLLECASERVWYATPDHSCFEYAHVSVGTPPSGTA